MPIECTAFVCLACLSHPRFGWCVSKSTNRARPIAAMSSPVSLTTTTTTTAAAAIPVSRNPLSPEDDVEQTHEWRAIAITNDAKTMAEEMRRITEVEAFEYASTKALLIVDGGTPQKVVHLYRRKKRPDYQKEIDTMATLLFQEKMLTLKRDIDQVQVAITDHRKAHPNMGW